MEPSSLVPLRMVMNMGTCRQSRVFCLVQPLSCLQEQLSVVGTGAAPQLPASCCTSAPVHYLQQSSLVVGVPRIPCQQQTQTVQAGSMECCSSHVVLLKVAVQPALRLSGVVALTNSYSREWTFRHGIPTHDSQYYYTQ